MRKTLLRQYLIHLIIRVCVVSFLLSNLIYIYSMKKEEAYISSISQIIAKNIDLSNVEFLLKSFKEIEEQSSIDIDILDINGRSIFSNNIENVSIKQGEILMYKQKVNFEYVLSAYYFPKDSEFAVKVSSFFNTFRIYFYVTLVVFVVNFIIYLFYIKNLKNNFIKPLSSIVKDNDIQMKYELEELQNLNFYLQNIKENFTKDIYKLKVENSKITYVLDNMSEGFLLIDQKMNVLTINKSAKKIFNCTEDAGKNIFHYTQNMKIITAIENAIKLNEKTNFDMAFGNKKFYSAYIDQVKKENINSNGSEYIIIILDVTTQRQNQKLKQDLFSNISHELKTPITSIKGYTELLQNNFADSEEQKQEFLDRIQKETQNVTQLINDILTISKLENKSEHLEATQINIKALVEEITKSFLPICIEKNINIQNNCENISINADYKNFYKLFNNLILNAVRYNKENGFVKIYCKEQGQNIEISVKDSGVGIPLEDKNRIFERFYRVENLNASDNVGTGLGLSIVKYIVKIYDGKIKVKTKLGAGSTFTIKIPKNKL